LRLLFRIDRKTMDCNGVRTRPNAVKTQVWIAICTYVLVAIIKKERKVDLSLHEILQILSISLFEKTPINKALSLESPTASGE
jgi:hypothetical protein